jgi:hypothetical protein|tara:strand:+ start:111 stop:344 length:234 start_codon:yes stop_codon:yes gene_type:complete
MIMEWSTYYKKHKHTGDINVVTTQYNMYVSQTLQSLQQFDVNLARTLVNNNRFIKLEGKSNYIILQEGFDEYGILQE